MHIFWKYINDSSLQMLYVGIFCQAHFMFFVLKPNEIL